jgi:hypothetical protein
MKGKTLVRLGLVLGAATVPGRAQDLPAAYRETSRQILTRALADEGAGK